jgi:hypothetical protein
MQRLQAVVVFGKVLFSKLPLGDGIHTLAE